jgi:hypothetical protein
MRMTRRALVAHGRHTGNRTLEQFSIQSTAALERAQLIMAMYAMQKAILLR